MKTIKLLTIATIGLSSISFADHHEKDEKITTVELKENFYLLQGEGGNILIFNGEQGTLMIDAKFARLSEIIEDSIKTAGGDTPKLLINTHFHGDHTGGNENFGKLGANIIAHENVYKRLTTETYIAAFDMRTPPLPTVALPVITFEESINYHFNDENIYAWHIPNAHTDGDSVVYFEKSNILHTGDIFFNGFYPFIDTSHGGSLEGMAIAAESLLNSVNENTTIVPGHGSVANAQDLENYSHMLRETLNILKPLKEEGLSAEQIIEKKPLAALEEEWGDGFLGTDKWINIVYPAL